MCGIPPCVVGRYIDSLSQQVLLTQLFSVKLQLSGVYLRLAVRPLSETVLAVSLPVSSYSLPVMGVGLEQWRASIGSYNNGKSYSLTHTSSSSYSSRILAYLNNVDFSLLYFLAITSLQSVMKALMLLILLSGDVERNPGPDIMGE